MTITTFSQDVSAFFAAGTSLGAYPASNWPVEKRPPAPGVAPVGSARATATSAASGVVSFTGLADSAEYYVSDAAGSRYVRFTTFPSTVLARSSDVATETTRATAAEALKIPLTAEGAASGVATLDSGTKIPTAQLPRAASGAQIAEPYSRPYTLYVDPQSGSDSNNGNSPGNAFLTLAKAVNTLQIGAHRGHIRIVTDDSTITLTAPIHVTGGIFFSCDAPSSCTIRRGFGTLGGRSVYDAVTTAGGSSVVSATAAFVSGDVGKIVAVYGAGVGGGTYYDFISAVPDGTHATLTGTTTIARNSTTDPHGVKLCVVGDWNRVVADAAMASGGSVITSATAAFTTADIGTEVVIAGAGQGGQALRTVISAVGSATQATVLGVSSATVSGKRCVIGVVFGDLFTFHVGLGGMRNFLISDVQGVFTHMGAPLKIMPDDAGAGSQQSAANMAFENLELSSTGAGGAWEHMLDVDGSWNQLAGGPGVRRQVFTGCKFFGSRRAAETIRIASACHLNFLGEGIVGQSPTSIAQGVAVLDPQKTGIGQTSVSDINFSGFEGTGAIFYSEGQFVSYHGGSIRPSILVSGRRAIELSPVSDHNSVVTINSEGSIGGLTGVSLDEYDAGTNNRIDTNVLKRASGKATEATVPSSLAFETFPRRGASNASTALGSSGVLVLQSVWLPGGYLVTKAGLQGGGTALAWGSGWSNPHFIVGLYDPDGNLIAQTADTGGTQVFNNAFTTNDLLSLTKDAGGSAIAGVRVPRSGLCFIGLLINSGTGGSAFTYPNFGGMTNSLAAISPPLAGTSGSSLTALPPSVTVPLSSGASVELYGGVV